jgi:hypothetical protein
VTDWRKAAQDAWSGWQESAREYHEMRGNRPLIVELEAERLARLRRLMQPSISLEQAYREINDPQNRPTPRVVIETILLTVRERGLAALKAPANLERLSRCDAAAKAEINERIEKLGPES